MNEDDFFYELNEKEDIMEQDTQATLNAMIEMDYDSAVSIAVELANSNYNE